VWSPAEFERLGYKVRGQGQESVERAYAYRRGGPRTCGPRPYTAFAITLTIFSGAVYYLRLISYFYPNVAHHMLCVKKTERSQRRSSLEQ
jgi:hypothetical protein